MSGSFEEGIDNGVDADFLNNWNTQSASGIKLLLGPRQVPDNTNASLDLNEVSCMTPAGRRRNKYGSLIAEDEEHDVGDGSQPAQVDGLVPAGSDDQRSTNDQVFQLRSTRLRPLPDAHEEVRHLFKQNKLGRFLGHFSYYFG